MKAQQNDVKQLLQLICDVAVDYDGYRDSENLMQLIDQIASYARRALSILEKKKCGHWEQRHIGIYHRCSVCGSFTGTMDDDHADQYCSKCGSEMSEEV